MNFDRDGIKEYDDMVGTQYGRGSYTYTPKKLDLDLKSRTTPPALPSIKEPIILELKSLLSHLCYAFWGAHNTLLVIIAADLVEIEVESLLLVL